MLCMVQVRDNIEKFSGRSDLVTVFGEVEEIYSGIPFSLFYLYLIFINLLIYFIFNLNFFFFFLIYIYFNLSFSPLERSALAY